MMRKLLIFILVMVFIASVSSVNAADENNTQTITETNDEVLEMEDASLEITESNVNENILTDDSQTIKMGKVTNRLNGGVYYTATFYDVEGNPIANQEMWFSVDGNNQRGYPVTTDSNGVALLKVALSNGYHQITAINKFYGTTESDTIKVFDVLTGGKNIEMYYDDGNTYKVRVFDDNGNPAKTGQKVTFTLNTKKYVRSTDKNGYASFKITAKPGYYYISAQYNDFKVANTVYVKEVLEAKTFSSRGKVSSKVKFTAKFLGKNKKNKTIKLKFNKKTYKAKTNKKGVATFNVKSPKKSGSYKTVFSYKKSKVIYQYTQYRTKV